MYNILVPMAGRGQRFVDKGFHVPKPLIMAKDKHIIDWSMEPIDVRETDEKCRIIFLVRADHVSNFSIDKVLMKKFGQKRSQDADSVEIIVVNKATRGSVETCLLAKDLINSDDPLTVYTPDVYFEPSIHPSEFDGDADGVILTFKANSDAYSYAQTDENGRVIRTAEKEVISPNAAVGLYHFKRGSDFVKYGEEMIEKDIRTKNEFYICPIYNMLIRDGLDVRIHHARKMHVMGTPEELHFFENYIQNLRDGKVALCCDHSGYDLKESAKSIFEELNIDYVDFGTYVDRDCDYNDYTSQALKALDTNVCNIGFGFCRTGQGINMFMNHHGARSALVFDTYTAEMAVRHNCANFFSIPSKYVDQDSLREIVYQIMVNTFDGGRHMTRMMKTVGDI